MKLQIILLLRKTYTYLQRPYRKRKWHCLIGALITALAATLNWLFFKSDDNIIVLERTYPDLESTNQYIQNKLQEALKEDKGTGCEFPQLDPFAKEIMQFETEVPRIHCEGCDWVKCYLSECRVTKDILKTAQYIDCKYRDILYINDGYYKFGPPTSVLNDGVYTLRKSDHVKVKCVGKHFDDKPLAQWTGLALGFRESVDRKEPPSGREDSVDVFVFAFDSTAKNGFIRRMPKSYEFLTKELGATVLNGYNIVGDATPAALFPILTGKTELELPDVRKRSTSNGSLDDMPFIFYKLKADGYRTAFFEDSPETGTFQYRFKGFKKQPADHYLRAFYLERSRMSQNTHTKPKGYHSTNRRSKTQRYCVGDTLNYKLMMNITEKFFKLDGKHFAFTFIADISHHDFNMITIADDDTRRFLKEFRDSGKMDNTLVIVMGDHGPRYSNVRNTLQGKFEERMPLMAIRLPEALKRSRPDVAAILQNNSQVLTTPHDIHATLLDAMGLQRYRNDYKIKGADLTRGMSLFEPIPRSRSCSEAGIEPHWCACVAWDTVPPSDAIYKRATDAFVEYINALTQSVRSKCVPRTLTSVEWVMRRKANSKMLSFTGSRDMDNYYGNFNSNFNVNNDYYQIKIVMDPGQSLFEGSMQYIVRDDSFIITERDISRISAYGDEPKCISSTHPHLNKYCYCIDKTS